MGYALEALIGPADVLAPMTSHRGARVLPLSGGLALLPMVEILRNAIQAQNHDPEREPAWPFWHLSPEGAMTIAETCTRGALAYVEARFYAGVGTQAPWAGETARSEGVHGKLRHLQRPHTARTEAFFRDPPPWRWG